MVASRRKYWSIFILGFFTISKAAGQCEPPWSLYNSVCYRYVGLIKSFSSAQTWCEEANGTLASVLDQDHNSFLVNLSTNSILEYYWIGLSRQSQTEPFTWLDGSEHNFTFWKQDEPDGIGNCGAIDQANNARWVTPECYHWLRFFCQKNPIAEDSTTKITTASITTVTPTAEDSTTKITTASITTVTPTTVDSTTKITTASITTVTPTPVETSENVQTTTCTPDIELKTTVSTSTTAKSTQKHQKSSLPQTTEGLLSTKEEKPVTTIKQEVSPLFIEADDRVSAKMIGLTSVIILVFFILVMVAFDLNLIISQLKEMVITVYTFVFRRND